MRGCSTKPFLLSSDKKKFCLSCKGVEQGFFFVLQNVCGNEYVGVCRLDKKIVIPGEGITKKIFSFLLLAQNLPITVALSWTP